MKAFFEGELSLPTLSYTRVFEDELNRLLGVGFEPTRDMSPYTTYHLKFVSIWLSVFILLGNRVDATPFQWSEDSPPYEDYCQILTDCGFNHWGTETMMSGSTGRQLEAQIYVGVVYYQRLRHMVADKYQVWRIYVINIIILGNLYQLLRSILSFWVIDLRE